MSSRMYLLLFLLTCAIGVTLVMRGSGGKEKPVADESTEATKTEPGLEKAPEIPPPVEAELPTASLRNPKTEVKPTDPKAPEPDVNAQRVPEPNKTPTPDDFRAPVDGGPAAQPPSAYPPPAYPPPVYPDGGFEGDVPPAPQGDAPDYDPENFGAPPAGDGEGF